MQNFNQIQSQEPPNKSGTPQEPQISQNPQKPEEPQVQKLQQGDYGDGVNVAVVRAMVDCALESIDSGGPGMPACGNVMENLAGWPQEYGKATYIVEGIRKERARAAAKAAEPPTEFYEDDQPRPASKKVKLSIGREDEQSKSQ